MREAPVFVVGIPRSGTTLLAAMLGQHSRLGCGTGSRVLARYRLLDPSARDALVDPPSWPARAVELIVAGSHPSPRRRSGGAVTRPPASAAARQLAGRPRAEVHEGAADA